MAVKAPSRKRFSLRQVIERIQKGSDEHPPYNISALARKLGVSRQVLHRYKVRGIVPRADTLRDLCNLAGVDINDVIIPEAK